MQAVHNQQTLVYQVPPGFAVPPQGNIVPSPVPAVQTDKFAHLRRIPMFQLSVGSDVPQHSHIVNKTAYQVLKPMKIYRSVLTRWAAPTGGATGIVVDVYQLRNPFSFGMSPFTVQVSRDANIRLGGKFDVSGCRGMAWSKHWTRQAIEEVLVFVNGVVVPLEIVERREERVAPEESEKVKQRFKSWTVPI